VLLASQIELYLGNVCCSRSMVARHIGTLGAQLRSWCGL
jgi:hypothetical protein